MSREKNTNVAFLESETFLYRLDHNFQVVPVPLSKLQESIEEVMESRWIYQTKVEGDILISSAFIGVSIPSIFNKQPLCFETMVFNADEEPCSTRRYRTLDECIEGHHATVQEVKTRGAATWVSDPKQSLC